MSLFLSIETAHGCTIETDKQAAGVELSVNTAKNATECAHLCSLEIRCEKFLFNSNLKECSKRKDSVIYPRPLTPFQGITSGFCPKGEAVLVLSVVQKN